MSLDQTKIIKKEVSDVRKSYKKNTIPSHTKKNYAEANMDLGFFL